MSDSIINLLEAVRFKSYKSFYANDAFSLSLDSRVMLIIGKNNSGKSSVIDVVESVFGNRQHVVDRDLSLSVKLNSSHINDAFRSNYFGDGENERSYGMKYRDAIIDIDFDVGKSKYKLSEIQQHCNIKKKDTFSYAWGRVVFSIADDINEAVLLRLNSERDIVPEKEKNEENVDSNGNGATNIVRCYINTDEYDESIVEHKILEDLNKIMDVDAHFSSIRVQQVKQKDYLWEIFLEESGQRYSLSKSGSGLKTIILILIYLHLLPLLKQYRNKNIMYAFEEIENNLHPALQRRIFEYLYDYAKKTGTKILITSHSNIAINTYYGKTDACLYHVMKTEGVSTIQRIDNGESRGLLLNDLGVKASDIFQTNGIIWVEGPSDRIYILKWLSVFSPDFSYSEGLDFQFLYYGGRLLAHYEASEIDSKTEGLINILSANRNSAVVIDSDKTSKQKPLNDTKKRIISELEKKQLYCWVTKGKEIENYVSYEAVNSVYQSELPQIEQYELFSEYIKKYDMRFQGKKVDVARKLSEYITEENSSKILDLKEKVLGLVEVIRKWNR